MAINKIYMGLDGGENLSLGVRKQQSFVQWPLFFMGHGPYCSSKFNSRMNPDNFMLKKFSSLELCKVFEILGYLLYCKFDNILR